jgi:hypothetical protein
VVRNLLIEAQTGEPAPGQMHAQLLDQFPFAGNAVEIADQKNAQQKFGINRRPTGLAVTNVQSPKAPSWFCLRLDVYPPPQALKTDLVYGGCLGGTSHPATVRQLPDRIVQLNH